MLFLTILVLILLVLFLFFLLFLFGFIHIALDAKYVGNKPDLVVTIFLWKLRLTTVRLSDMKMSTFPLKFFIKGNLDTTIKDIEDKLAFDKTDLKKMHKTWESITSKVKEDRDLTDKVLSLFRIHDIKWSTTLGLEEAPLTAFTVGMVWTAKYILIGRLMEWVKGMERPMVDIRPSYNELIIQTHIKCMITFRLGKAILAAYRIAKIRKRRQVGKCQNIQYKA